MFLFSNDSEVSIVIIKEVYSSAETESHETNFFELKLDDRMCDIDALGFPDWEQIWPTFTNAAKTDK